MNWTRAKRREVLPAQIDPAEKLSFFSVIKDSIGKDLSKITMPVYFNQPISILQQQAQMTRYHKLLDQANQIDDDSCQRLAYVMVFAAACFSIQVGKSVKKPFNPLLGETYELIDDTVGLRTICEQVSHHPPISAIHTDSINFQIWGNSNGRQRFNGKQMVIEVNSLDHILLKKHNDHFTYNRATTTINNLIFGTTYIDFQGNQAFKNHNTQDTGILQHVDRGWNDSGAYQVKGSVKDASGTEKYTIKGKWNDELIIVNKQTKQEIVAWRFSDYPPGQAIYYGFDDFTLNINHLNDELAQLAASTDTRFRPDQRALENGWRDLAASEKERLEVKQRVRRKEYETKNKHHTAKWFVQQQDKQAGNPDTLEFVYKGGYFEQREAKSFGQLLDIY